MNPALNHQPSQFARPVPPGLDAKTARRTTSLAPRRAVTLIIDDQDQMGTDTALGQRMVVCRFAPALGRTGRFGGLGFAEWFLPLFDASLNYGRCANHIGRLFEQYGIGRHANASVAINHSPRDCALQCFAKGLHSHFQQSLRHHVLDSHDANENGLTHAEIAFAPGAKTHV